MRVPRVRVIGAEAEQLGILTRDEALALAQEYANFASEWAGEARLAEQVL
ncbi:MAG: hypothetical protein ACHP7C_05405 [Lysobacterales bacterium]